MRKLSIEHTHKKPIFTPEALIPFSIVCTIAMCIWLVAQISSLAATNEKKISALEKLRQDGNRRIYDRLNRIDQDLGDLKSQISAQSGKLDLLIELNTPK